jgi:hypothetical protein
MGPFIYLKKRKVNWLEEKLLKLGYPANIAREAGKEVEPRSKK